MLEDIRSGETDDNAQRQKNGYPTMHLAGCRRSSHPMILEVLMALIWGARSSSFRGEGRGDCTP